MYMALKPTWTAQHIAKKRGLGFIVTDTKNPAYGHECQSGGGHTSNVQNGNVQKSKDPNDKTQSEGLKPDSFPNSGDWLLA